MQVQHVDLAIKFSISSQVWIIEAAELAEHLETEKGQLVEVYNMQVRINQPDQLNIYQAFYS